jgi:hypothetical protein
MTNETMISANRNPECAAGAIQAAAFPDMQAAKAIIVAESSQLCAAAVHHSARAIVLTGSMSRGEATLKREDAGWRVLGDATFLLVFDGPVQVRVAELEQEIEQTLLGRGIQCKIVVVTATSANLRNMRPHIYAYELRERGIVVWGDKAVLRSIPGFTVADIPKEDGWWLLCNRMIEQLESAVAADGFSDDSTAVRYRIAKLYLAMAACYLLAIEQYGPSYRERVARLNELAASDNPPSTPISLQRFSRFVSQCTELKLHGEVASGHFPRWSEAVSDAEMLWRWALGRMLGLSASLSRAELLAELAARQPIFARAKGWVRAAYVSPTTFRRNWLRWARLASSTSPRYLVYGAASELCFATPQPGAITANELVEIVARLPLAPSPAGQQLSWLAAAKLVAHNFHVFLESTRS